MTRPRLLAIAVAALVCGVFFAVQWSRWSGAAGAQRANDRFLSYLGDRRWSKCHGMISESYKDAWGFDRDDLSLALQDIGSPFTFGWTIEWTPDADGPLQLRSGPYRIQGRLRIDGTGTPVAGMVSSYANSYSNEPFSFNWTQDGIFPWNRKLTRISHPNAEIPADYTPGSLGSAASGRF